MANNEFGKESIAKIFGLPEDFFDKDSDSQNSFGLPKAIRDYQLKMLDVLQKDIYKGFPLGVLNTIAAGTGTGSLGKTFIDTDSNNPERKAQKQREFAMRYSEPDYSFPILSHQESSKNFFDSFISKHADISHVEFDSLRARVSYNGEPCIVDPNFENENLYVTKYKRLLSLLWKERVFVSSSIPRCPFNMSLVCKSVITYLSYKLYLR